MQNMNWNYPTNVWFGPDRSQQIQQACDSLDIKNPLIVTDPGLLQAPIIDEINSNLYIISEGINIGRLKGKRLIPNEALAFSTELNLDKASTFELNLEETLNYLRKENFDFESMPNGWNLITYQGLGLGWANRIQQRVNNYYPTNWRIRISS